jgi:hypothetical protein
MWKSQHGFRTERPATSKSYTQSTLDSRIGIGQEINAEHGKWGKFLRSLNLKKIPISRNGIFYFDKCRAF